MSPVAASWLVCLLCEGGIAAFTAREIALYVKDQRSRTDIYPYTRSKLVRRFAISLILALEAVLLLPARHTLTPDRPVWFAAYVALVGLGALALVALALFDYREARELHQTSARRLMEEFIHELKQEKSPPPTH